MRIENMISNLDEANLAEQAARLDDPNNPNVCNGRWTDQEHDRFVEALRLFGKDWNKI